MSANDSSGGLALERCEAKNCDPFAVIPSQVVQESALIGASSTNVLDIPVVGCGVTGTRVALDVATRGLRVGLVELEDFSSGTSSRSTKLVYGGIYVFGDNKELKEE